MIRKRKRAQASPPVAVSGRVGGVAHGRCPACGVEIRESRYRGFSSCPNCSLVLRDPMPTFEELEGLYGAAWRDPLDQIEMTGATDALLARTYAKKLAGSLGLPDFSGMKILDYGAGRGDMLTALEALGADVIAVERFGGDLLGRSGRQVFPALEEIPADVRFDGVVIIDVVEHLPEPGAVLGEIRGKLREGGWLYMATPNAASLRARIQGSQWPEALNPVHLFLYNPRTLSSLLEAGGFRRVARLRWMVRYSTGPARSFIQWVLQALRLDGELRYLAR